MTKKKQPCPYCGRDTKGSGVTAREGLIACQLCWLQHHPPTPTKSFDAMMMRPEGRNFMMQWVKDLWRESELLSVIEAFDTDEALRYTKRLNQLLEERSEEEKEGQ